MSSPSSSASVVGSGTSAAVNSPPLALPNPSSGKIDQQRKILEELERQKKLLSGTGKAGGDGKGGASTAAARTTAVADSLAPPPPHLLSSNQRNALEQASKSSFGYFIAQDSSFGNTILPVIPRLEETAVNSGR